MPKFCPGCGAMMSDNSSFCQGCGAKLDDFEFIPQAKEKKDEQTAQEEVQEQPEDAPEDGDAPEKEEAPTDEEPEDEAPAEDAEDDTPKCPNGEPARWIEQYKRWYCDDTKEYLAKDLPPPSEGEKPALEPAKEEEAKEESTEEGTADDSTPKCPNGKPARWIEQYKRWYCDDTGEYLAKDLPGPGEAAPAEDLGGSKASADEIEPSEKAQLSKEEAPAEDSGSPEAAQSSELPEEDSDKAKEEAPADDGTPKCPNGKPARWIEQYKRWYCDDTGEYLAKDLPGPGEAAPAEDLGGSKASADEIEPSEKAQLPKEEAPAEDPGSPEAAQSSELPEEEPDKAKEEAPADDGTPKCPNGQPARWVEQYKRWYCDDTKEYLAKDLPGPSEAAPAKEQKDEAPADDGTPKCPNGKPARWVEQYKRWYCDDTKEYLAKDLPGPGEAKEEAPAEDSGSPEAAQSSELPEDDSDKAKEEAPADNTPKCPNGEPARWIEQYKRWYCDDTKEYLAKDLPGPGAEPAAPEPAPAADPAPAPQAAAPQGPPPDQTEVWEVSA